MQKSPMCTQCRPGGSRTGSVWSEREDQGEGIQNSGKTGTGVRGRDMGVEEGTGKETGGRRNENATMDVRS